MVRRLIMPRRGENIRKRTDGRWEGRYKCSSVIPNTKTRYKSIYGKSYSEVKQRLLLAAQEQQLDIAAPAINCPFSKCAVSWLDSVSQRCKYSTYIKYQYILECHLKNFANGQCISQITNAMCEEYLIKEQYAAGQKLSLSTMKTICYVLNQILKYGKSSTHISLPDRVVQAYKYDSKDVAVFSADEQKRLLDLLFDKTDRYKLGILICLFSGLRLGEICALRIDDIDMCNKCINVSQTVQRLKNGTNQKTMLYCAAPKSPNSIRTIPLCDTLFHLLTEMDLSGEYLLNRKSPMEPRTYQYMFSRYLNSAHISSKNFHSLRHTFATNCIENGMDVKCLSEILGHSDVKTTMNRYVHPTMDNKRYQINKCLANYGKNSGHLD